MMATFLNRYREPTKYDICPARNRIPSPIMILMFPLKKKLVKYMQVFCHSEEPTENNSAPTPKGKKGQLCDLRARNNNPFHFAWSILHLIFKLSTNIPPDGALRTTQKIIRFCPVLKFVVVKATVILIEFHESRVLLKLVNPVNVRTSGPSNITRFFKK